MHGNHYQNRGREKTMNNRSRTIFRWYKRHKTYAKTEGFKYIQMLFDDLKRYVEKQRRKHPEWFQEKKGDPGENGKYNQKDIQPNAGRNRRRLPGTAETT